MRKKLETVYIRDETMFFIIVLSVLIKPQFISIFIIVNDNKIRLLRV